MAAQLLDGQKVADEAKSHLTSRVAGLAAKGKVPGLGTILVGDDASSARYVAMKHKDCQEIGITSFHQHLSSSVTQEELESVIDSFNNNPEIDAYLVRILPIPK